MMKVPAYRRKLKPMSSEWHYDCEHETWSIRGRDCLVWMSPRPPYCDRGRWLANVELLASAFPRLSIDHSDMWPRYYFDLDRAKAEIEAWLRVREQFVEPANVST